MKHCFLLLVFSTGLAGALTAQIRLAAVPESCNTVKLSVAGLPEHPGSRLYRTWWVEKLIAPGAWSASVKKTNLLAEEIFDALPAGTYRAVCLFDSTADSDFREALVSTLFRLMPCGVNSSVLPAVPGVFLLTPNPAAGILRIHTGNPGEAADARLDLYDLAGKCMLSAAVESDGQEIPVAGLPPGIYLARLWQNGISAPPQKLIILHP